MKRVRCDHRANTCPNSCPHKEWHQKADICTSSKCSWKGILVRCDKASKPIDSLGRK